MITLFQKNFKTQYPEFKYTYTNMVVNQNATKNVGNITKWLIDKMTYLTNVYKPDINTRYNKYDINETRENIILNVYATFIYHIWFHPYETNKFFRTPLLIDTCIRMLLSFAIDHGEEWGKIWTIPFHNELLRIRQIRFGPFSKV